jgi:hypothetical protein
MVEMLRDPDNSRTRFPNWPRKLEIERKDIKRRVAVAILLVAIAAQAQHAGDEEMQLESALHQEIVLGDLKGAIERYRAILEQRGTAKPVAARALLHIGQCQEKSGEWKEAYTTYRRVAADYGDQAEIAAQARVRLVAWSAPRNLKFEEGAPGKAPPGWFVPSLPKDADYLVELRRAGCRSGVGCAVVLVPANVPRPVGNMMQSFSAAAYRGRTVRLRAWLRLEGLFVAASSIRFPGPDDRAQMWLNVERANHQKGFSDNMDDRPVRSSDWTRCEIVAQIDDDAQFINFGVMSIGGGRVWVDDVSFEVVPN